MNRNQKSRIFLLLVALIALSCSEYHVIIIENKQLPKIRIPDEIQSLTLMNRSLTNDFYDFNEDSLQMYFYKNKFDVRTNVLDSLASDTCLQAIGELLYESGRYDIVIPVERNIKRDLEYFRIEQPLSWDYVDKVCKTYNTDALLVMEKYVNKVNSSFQVETNPITQNEDIKHTFLFATYDIIYDSFFRMYYPEIKEVVGQFFINDTIFWEHGDFNKDRLFKKLRSIKRGLIDAGITVAIDLNENISPSWVSDKRGVFLIEKKNPEEKELISNASWSNLKEYWLPITENENKRIRSKAEYNMALASELDGKIDDAIFWASKSYQSTLSNRSLSYIKKLKKRKAELIKIEQCKNQLFNF